MNSIPAEILAYIINYKSTHDGNSPSYRQIQAACNLSSTSRVFYYMDVLEKQKSIKILYDDRERPSRCIAVVGGRWEMSNG